MSAFVSWADRAFEGYSSKRKPNGTVDITIDLPKAGKRAVVVPIKPDAGAEDGYCLDWENCNLGDDLGEACEVVEAIVTAAGVGPAPDLDDHPTSEDQRDAVLPAAPKPAATSQKQKAAKPYDSYKPGCSVHQKELLSYVILQTRHPNGWAKPIDIIVLDALLKEYYFESKPQFHQRPETARMGVRKLAARTLHSQRKVIDSLGRLKKYGVIEVERAGTWANRRETEYKFFWSIARDLGPLRDEIEAIGEAKLGVISSTCDTGDLQGTCLNMATRPGDPQVTWSGDPQVTWSGDLQGTISLSALNLSTCSPGSSSIPPSEGAPTPPTAATARGTGRGEDSAGDPFEELCAAYGETATATARKAYVKLKPDTAMHMRLVDAAKTWREIYDAHGTTQRFRKRLKNWLADGLYDEPGPQLYYETNDADDIERLKPPAFAGVTGAFPGRHIVKITSMEIFKDEADGAEMFRFVFEVFGGEHHGREISHEFYLGGQNETFVAEGQEYFFQIRKATGIEQPKDQKEFEGKMLAATFGSKGQVKYEMGSTAAARVIPAAAAATIH